MSDDTIELPIIANEVLPDDLVGVCSLSGVCVIDDSSIQKVSNVPVIFSSHADNQGASIKTNPDGSMSISTLVVENKEQTRKLITPVKIKNLLILASVSLILYFPCGIFALYFAIKAKYIFYEKLENNGGPVKATKSYKYSQNFSKVSLFCFLMSIGIVLTVIEYFRLSKDENHRSSLHSSSFMGIG